MGNFQRSEAVAVLERTPHALRCLLDGVPDAWLDCDEGPDTFSPREVEPFDRFGHRAYADRPVHELLDELERLRRENLDALRDLVADEHLDRRGFHPALGGVSMRQLLSAWVVHDFTHIAQIARVMAHRYAEDVGPWAEYMGVLQWRR